MSKYIDKIKEHFPGASINSAYGMCPGGFFKFGMREDIPDCTGDCALCWNAEAPEDEVYCDRGEYDIPEDWRASPASEAKNIINAQAAATAETFNYAVLSAELGDYLRRKEEQLKNEYMNFTANCGRIFAEAQEKLAGSNQYNGMFEKWITAMGFNKQTVYNMISVFKFRSSKILTSEQNQLFDSLSKSLQYEVAKPSAPPELVEQVINGDITTHKEYIALKKQLEAQMQRYSKALDENHSLHDENQELRRDRINALNRADNAERELSDAKAEIEKLNREADEADREYDAMADRECHYETEICELKHQIKELEAQPRDVAIQLDEETLAKKDQEISELKEEILRMNDKNIKSFIIRMSLDEYDLLLNALEPADDRLKNIIKNARIFRI